MTRAFLAIKIQEGLKDGLLEVSHALEKHRLHATNPENLHLTLNFFGEVDRQKIDAISNALSEVKSKPFEMTIKGIGHFNPSYRVVFAKVLSTGEELKDLHAEIVKSLRRSGIEHDERFTPHITIAKARSRINKKEVESTISKYKEEEFGKMKVSSIGLYGSLETQNGREYTLIKSFPLRK